jgi:hypothetical protein
MTDILFLEDEYGVRLPVSDEKIREIQDYHLQRLSFHGGAESPAWLDTEIHYGIEHRSLQAILGITQKKENTNA